MRTLSIILSSDSLKRYFAVPSMACLLYTSQALRNKVISKDKYQHLEDITDILGCRILTLFESDVERILELLEDTFEVCEIVDKRKKSKHLSLIHILAGRIYVRFSEYCSE